MQPYKPPVPLRLLLGVACVEGVAQGMGVGVGDHMSPSFSSNSDSLMLPQVWVVPELRADGRIYWRADSDSQLTKGLAALLVNGLSGCSPEEILRVQVGGRRAAIMRRREQLGRGGGWQ